MGFRPLLKNSLSDPGTCCRRLPSLPLNGTGKGNKHSGIGSCFIEARTDRLSWIRSDLSKTISAQTLGESSPSGSSRLPTKGRMKISASPWKGAIMKLRRPQDELAGCCWLARIVDKVRAAQGGDFPLLYRLSLGSPIGIDGHFLRHFHLPFHQFKTAVLETRTDDGLAQWFLSQPNVNTQAITRWNEYAPKLGTPGYPGSMLRHLIKWFVYPKACKKPVNSLFEMIEQDETP